MKGEKIKKFFRSILKIVNEQTKGEVVDQVKDYYDYEDFIRMMYMI